MQRGKLHFGRYIVGAHGFSAPGEFKQIRGEFEFEDANSISEGSTSGSEFGANSNSREFVRIRTCILTFFSNALRGLAIKGFDFSCFAKMEHMQNSHNGNCDK